jgi:uncharacterized iron-regulated membrane protein
MKSRDARRWVSPRAFRLFWDSHSFAGVLFGLALFVIFYAGAFSLFRAEIMVWADPALGRPVTDGAMPDANDVIVPLLETTPPAPGAHVMIVYPFAGRAFYWLRYDAESGGRVDTWVGADSGDTVPPRGRSRLSEILYKLHYFQQLGTFGRVTSGIVAVVLGFGLVSGLLIHLHKLPERLHTFRPRAALKVALADVHAALGTIGLPFTLMYAITGAFFSLLIVLLGPTILLVFDGDQEAIDALLSGVRAPVVETGDAPASMMTPDALTGSLATRWGRFEPLRLDYHGWGRVGARATVEGAEPETLTTSGKALLDPETGRVLQSVAPRRANSLGRTVAVMTNLHFASFGGLVLDLVFFVLALAASAVIVSGNLLWLLARRAKDARSTPWVHRMLARLTVGASAGLTAAVPLTFVISQALPLDAPGRRAVEDAAFFGGWLTFILLAFRGRSTLSALRWQLGLAGVLSLAAPIARGVSLGTDLWLETAVDAWVVDLGLLLSGATLLAAARQMTVSARRRSNSSAA